LKNYFIHLYDEPNTKNLDIKYLADYLKGLFPNVEIDVRAEFLTYHSKLSLDELAKFFAKIRIKEKPSEPTYGEIEVEKRNLKKGVKGVLYDGFKLSNLFYQLLSEEESNLRHIHLCLTPRLIATYDFNDRRYHIRSIILTFPPIISLSGIVEGPAKPKEFYLALRTFRIEDIPLVWERLKEDFKEKFIDYNDERINEVLKGYFLQAIFYQWFGEVFCEDVNCRLYNSHWQEEIIESQIRSGKLCDKHRKILEEFTK